MILRIRTWTTQHLLALSTHALTWTGSGSNLTISSWNSTKSSRLSFTLHDVEQNLMIRCTSHQCNPSQISILTFQAFQSRVTQVEWPSRRFKAIAQSASSSTVSNVEMVIQFESWMPQTMTVNNQAKPSLPKLELPNKAFQMFLPNKCTRETPTIAGRTSKKWAVLTWTDFGFALQIQ